MLRSILFLFLMISSSAFALEFKRLPDAYDGTQVLEISGRFEQHQIFPAFNLDRPTRIVLNSQGGNTNGIQPFVNWFEVQLRYGKMKPTVIITTNCSSSCIVVLSRLNNLAGSGRMELILDSSVVLGFHGCLDAVTQSFHSPCSKAFLTAMMDNGVNPQWVNQHLDLFIRPSKDYTVYVKATEDHLRDSGLINHASVEEGTLRLIRSH